MADNGFAEDQEEILDPRWKALLNELVRIGDELAEIRSLLSTRRG